MVDVRPDRFDDQVQFVGAVDFPCYAVGYSPGPMRRALVKS